jgi:PPM family protein phosphatase
LVSGYLSIEQASLSDVGVRRSHNQDSHRALPAHDAAQWTQRGHLFVVADGMGAHAVGELASKIAADNIPHIYFKHAQEGPAAALRTAILETNTAIHTRGQQNREFEGMGTTGTVLVLRPEGAWIGHVGDSRAYRVRAGKIEQLSFDHSLVWELARRQGVQPEALQGIPSNVIVRSLGPEALVQVDVEGPHPIEAGDIYVMCSDGLSGPVSDREIGAVVSALPPKEACRFLIDLANLQGGPDNITVIVVRVLGSEAEKAAGQADTGTSGKNHRPVATKSGPGWRLPVAWPLAALVLGILLALAAIGITYAKLGIVLGLLVFVLAAAALGAGIVGLLMQNRQESRAVDENGQNTDLRIHRRAACDIELTLLKKLAHAEALLEDRIRDHQWTADWDDCKKHHDLAEQHLNEGALTDAFREFCLAMRPLSEALERQRNKEENFQPVWDKPTLGEGKGERA